MSFRMTSFSLAAIAPQGLLQTLRLHTRTAVASASSQMAVRNAPTPPAPNSGEVWGPTLGALKSGIGRSRPEDRMGVVRNLSGIGPESSKMGEHR